MLVPQCIFAKCTQLACLLSFASLFLWLTPSPDCWKGRVVGAPSWFDWRERNQSFRWWIENLLSLEYMYTLWSSTYLTIPFPLFQWIENTLSIEYTRSDDFYPTLPFLLLLWSKPSQDSVNSVGRFSSRKCWPYAHKLSWTINSASFPLVSEFVTLFL